MYSMRRNLWFFAVLCSLPLFAKAQPAPGISTDELPLMPMPANVERQAGELLLNGQFQVQLTGYTEPRLERARARFLTRLTGVTGILFGIEPMDSTSHALTIHTRTHSDLVQKLGEDEGYRLVVTAEGAEITAANPLGAMHGLQTFLQLVRNTPQGFAVPAVMIEDKPRFPWRGLMIDTGRHFIPLPVILGDLDGMEAAKLNVFHWHLSEDQGFRAESKVFPLLQGKGSNGQYYTQPQMREVVEYARDRGIRVVPEFDMPAHAQSWLVGYPQLGSGKGPYQIATTFGVLDGAIDPTRESTYVFLNRFLGEMTALFPDAYFHIGGDECNGKEWDANPRIQEFMRVHKLKDDAALQAYFTARVQKLVAAHGKIMEGWDEVLQPETPKQVVIQSWRGRDSLLDAAQRGYRALLSNGYYIDLSQPASEHYLVDPLEGIADKLTPAQAENILGGEATIWSEYVSGETIDSRIWPRTAAIAERFWSPANVRDLDSMYTRLEAFTDRLPAWGIDTRATTENMLERMSGMSDPKALRVLASAVQPPKGYTRGGLRHYFTYTPLDHLVDAVPPESDVAREFTAVANRIAAGSGTQADWEQAREWLTLWRGNDHALAPVLDRSAITAELAPLSANLSQVAGIGLDALLVLESRQPTTASQQEEWMEVLKAAEKPQAVLVLPIVAPVEALVAATGKRLP